MNKTIYGVIVRRSPHDTRRFARISRDEQGQVVVAWAANEPHRPRRVPAHNPHATYHRDGRSHSKSYNKPRVIKHRQKPGLDFKGRVQLEAINADRMLSLDLPVCLPSDFDDYLEVPIEIIRKENKQFVSVDLVEPGVEALRLTGHDKVVMEATFKDKVPWIVVTLGEQPQV